jgi:hypothetical protein
VPEVNDAFNFKSMDSHLIDCVKNGGVSTTVAYGQTNSGKTHTSIGIMMNVGLALWREKNPAQELRLSFYELRLDKCIDLVSVEEKVCSIREDGDGEVRVNAESILLNDEEHIAFEIQRLMDARKVGGCHCLIVSLTISFIFNFLYI